MRDLRESTLKELIQLARRRNIPGCNKLTKAQLVRKLAVSKAKTPTRKAAVATQKKPSRPAKPAAALPELLNAETKRVLLQKARKASIAGARTMSKPELVKAIVKCHAGTNGVAGPKSAAVAAAARRTQRSRQPAELFGRKHLSTNGGAKGPYRADKVIAMVRDPFWLHVFWEISTDSVQRTEAALGPDWYRAQPILRLIDVTSEDTTAASEAGIRDIEIHGGVNNWYINLDGVSRRYRVDIGYRTDRGRFFALARSNVVAPPRPGSNDNADGHWKSVREDCDRIFALSGGSDPYTNSDDLQKFLEERFRRPLAVGSLSSYGSGALGSGHGRGFYFDVNAELIVHGKTRADARVQVQGEPVKLRKDGSFTIRFGLPEGRQILPATASTNDGIEERTIILAIERNTKELEPMIHDGQEQ